MIRIAICEDDQMDLNIINDMTIDLLDDLSIDYEIKTFNNASSFLNERLSFDLLFLDIEMEPVNGIDLAKKIRTYDQNIKIVFITNSTEYLQIGYKVKAERYLLKPLNKDEFNYEISTVLKEKIIDNKYIIDKQIGPFKLYLNEIVYIEFSGRKTIVHKTDGDKIYTNITINKWLEYLKSYNFSQSHKAFIINLRYVKKLEKNLVIIDENTQITLTRKFKAAFENDYYSFIGALL